MSNVKKAETVNLVTKTADNKEKARKFEVSVANRLLTMRNAKWQLKDDAYKFNGKELAKNGK